MSKRRIYGFLQLEIARFFIIIIYMRNAKKSGKVIEMEGSAKQEPILEDSNGREIMR
jgi:hypothetical protein